MNGLWTRWSLQPAVVAGILASGLAYAQGIRLLWSRAGTGRGIRRWQVACFAGGLAAVVAALVSPVDALSHELFSVHMVQHLLLIMVAAPLLVLGAPLLPLSLILPPRWRRGARRLAARRTALGAVRVITLPAVAWTVHVAVVWAWHAPGPYQAALSDPAVHALEHASFLGSAMLFWWVLLAAERHRRLAPGADVLYVFLAGLQGAALGALFTFSTSPLYPYYLRRVSVAHLSPLQDQQLAGLIMWIPAGVIYLAVAGALFVRWVGSLERELPPVGRVVSR